MFPRTRCELSRIFNFTINTIFASHGHLLNLNHPYLQMPKIEEFAATVHQKGSPYKNCFGFVDGTVRPLCRPVNNQREVINKSL
jgi:hypothetical protein